MCIVKKFQNEINHRLDPVTKKINTHQSILVSQTVFLSSLVVGRCHVGSRFFENSRRTSREHRSQKIERKGKEREREKGKRGWVNSRSALHLHRFLKRDESFFLFLSCRLHLSNTIPAFDAFIVTPDGSFLLFQLFFTDHSAAHIPKTRETVIRNLQ